MRLYVLRHGETDWNVQRRFQGHSDTLLNEKGLELARITGKGLADVPFDLAFTSPLRRARKTAELILKGRDVPLFIEPRLIEIAFGMYEGVRVDFDFAGRQNQNLLDFLNRPERYQAPLDGESFESLNHRLQTYLEELCHRPDYAHKTILLSTHGAACTALLNAVDPPKGFFWRSGVPYNCSYSIIDVDETGKAVLVAENQICYDRDSAVQYYGKRS